MWCFNLVDDALNKVHETFLHIHSLEGFQKQLKVVVSKIKKHLKKHSGTVTSIFANELAFELTKILPQAPGDKHRPGVILFERQKFKLKPLQAQDLELVMNSKDLLLQRMMSYGKTAVLGVLMVFLKAQKGLSILVLPSALNEVNSVEVISKAREIFQQRGHAVTFSRDNSFSSVERLELLLTTIVDAVNNHDFLTMTAETVQAMQNKFVELLEIISRPDARPSNALLRRLELLRKILYSIREKSVPTFDEIDGVFSPFKELNFPLTLAPSMDRAGLLATGYVMLLVASDTLLSKYAGLVHNQQAQMLPKDQEMVRECVMRRLIHEILVEKSEDQVHGIIRTSLVITESIDSSGILCSDRQQ